MANAAQITTWNDSRFKVMGLLRSHYKCVSSLKEHLHSVIADRLCLQGLQQPDDKPRYTSLLETLLVCHQGETMPPRFTSYVQQSHQEEIIVTVVARLQRTGQTKNLIVYGFSKSSGNVQTQASSSHQVECTYPSYTCNFLMSRPWKTLLLRIGDEVLVHLLGSMSLFAFAEPSCYVQLTGIPVYEFNVHSQLPPVHQIHTQGTTLKSKEQCSKRSKRNWLSRKKKAAINQLVKKKSSGGKPLEVQLEKSSVTSCERQEDHMKGVEETIDSKELGKVVLSKENREMPSCSEKQVVRSSMKSQGCPAQKRRASEMEGSLNMQSAKKCCFQYDMKKTRMVESAHAKQGKIISDARNQLSIAKRTVLYGNCQFEGLGQKHFLRTMSTDEDGLKMLLSRIFLNSPVRPSEWPTQNSFKIRKIGKSHRERITGTKTASGNNNFTSLREKNDAARSTVMVNEERQNDSQVIEERLIEGTGTPTDGKGLGNEHLKSHETRPSQPLVSKDNLYKHAPRLVDGMRSFIKLNRKCNPKAILEKNCPLLCEGTRKERVKTKVPKLTGPVYKRNRGRKLSQTGEDYGNKQTDDRPCSPDCPVTGAPCTKPDVGTVAGHKKVMNKLLNSHYEPKKVYQWLRVVCRNVLPIRFWGTAQNQQAFLRSLLKFVKAGKFERLSTNELIHGIKVEKMSILGDFCSHSDREKALVMLIHWLMVGLFMPLLKAYFYVTDSATFRNRLFYYRKRAWSRVEKLAVEDSVKYCHFKPLTKAGAARLLSRGALTVSNLRYVPKADGVRPIVTLSGNPAKSSPEDTVSANKQLVNVFHLLTHIKSQAPSLVGCSVLGQNEIHAAWRQFTERRRTLNDNRPLYFLKLDIEHCYDSMDQQLLLDIVSEYIKLHPEYVVRRYVKLVSDGGKAKRTFCRQVVPLVDLVPDPLQFTTKLQQGAAPLHDAILIDQVHHRAVSADSLLTKLTAHIKMNLVSVGGCEYLQTKGISQGSVLSPLLCAFYYGRMETEHLLKPEPAELLLRQVDDFLFVTPDINRATTFLDTLLKGIPKFGCHVNAKKTLTSFPVPGRPQVACLSPKDLFPWCGLLLDTDTLAVRADYSRYSTLRCGDTLTFDTSHTPGQAILTKLTRCAKLQFQSVLVDSTYNDTHTVTVNIYQMALLVAERLVHCERALPANRNATTNLPFFISTIFKLTSILTKLYHHKCSHVRSPPSLGENQVRWVVLQAMVCTLAKTRSRHRRLESAVLHHQHDVSKQMTKEDVKWLRSVVEPVPLLAFLKD